MVGGYMRGVVLVGRVMVCKVCLRALSAAALDPQVPSLLSLARVGLI